MRKLLAAISAEWFFLIMALTFGVAIMIMTPPFQVPDEFHHFYREYQLSEGQVKPVKIDGRMGGFIPSDIVNLSETFMPVRYRDRTNAKTIDSALNKPLNIHDIVFADFPNTALYSPICYLPQTLSICLLKPFHPSIGVLFYGARLFAFVTWLLCVFYAIRIIPVFKWLFTFFALLPMSVYINTSLSGDVVTNAGAFLLIAFILKHAIPGKRFTLQSFIIIALLTILLAITKLVYTPIVLLFLIIPRENFRSKKAFYFQFSAILLMGLIVMLAWSAVVSAMYVPYFQYNPLYRDNNIDTYYGTDMHGQIQYVLVHKLHFFRVIYNTLTIPFKMYFDGYIGTLGWLDCYLPLWIYITTYVLLFSVSIFEEGNAKIKLTTFHKATIFTGFIAMVFLLILSQYLAACMVGDKYVTLMQGRYFIPIYPLLFMLFYNRRYNAQKIVVPTVIFFSIFILSITVLTIYSRYYKALPLPTFLIAHYSITK